MGKDKKVSKEEKNDRKNNTAQTEIQEEAVDAQTDSTQPEEAAAEAETELDSLTAKIKELEEQVAQLKDKELRQFAEFDNFRKRTQREKAETYKNAAADCILPFITVLDNLERALEASAEDNDFKSGIEMIVKQFREVLAKQDVHEIEALNQVFDPLVHNAVNQVEDENFGENTICQVFQKGYKMGDKVIRHAMVVVANP